MKIKSLIAAMLPVLFGLLALQSCTKEDGKITIYQSFTTPTVTAPLNGATIKITGTTVDLKWVSTDGDGDAPLADVYFGLDSKPALYKAGNTATTLNVPVVLGKTYYWKVVMKDANKVTTTSDTWSFTVFEPIGIFVGNYNCDEPAEAYSYGVSFVKVNDNTIRTSNYWNSGWAADFTLDFTKNTYSMAKTVWGTDNGIESGTIDPATGKMVGNYTINYVYKGQQQEVGVHTYTKK